MEEYIRQRLATLDKRKDMDDVIWKGKFSFGLNAREWSHLPSWTTFLKKHRSMVRWAWISAFVLTFLTISFLRPDLYEQIGQDPLAGIAKLIGIGFVIGLFCVMGDFLMLFTLFRDAEREVRKLIYEDILVRIEHNKQESEKREIRKAEA